jgi:hypothetical protein
MRCGLQNLRPRDDDHLYDIVHVEGRALSVAAAFPPPRARFLAMGRPRHAG